MQGVLDAEGWQVRLAGAVGSNWIETDWIVEVALAYQNQEAARLT